MLGKLQCLRMTQGDQCEQLNLRQYPERSKVMSVCGVTEDYKENFEKAVLQKRKEQVFNIHQQHFRITVFFFFFKMKGLNMLNIHGKEPVEKYRLKIKG